MPVWDIWILQALKPSSLCLRMSVTRRPKEREEESGPSAFQGKVWGLGASWSPSVQSCVFPLHLKIGAYLKAYRYYYYYLVFFKRLKGKDREEGKKVHPASLICHSEISTSH